MMTQESASLEHGKPVELKQMQIFTLGRLKIVPQRCRLKECQRKTGIGKLRV